MDSHSGILAEENRRGTRRKTCPSATLSTTNPTCTDSGAKPGLRAERPVTNDLSHGTAHKCNLSSYEEEPRYFKRHSALAAGREIGVLFPAGEHASVYHSVQTGSGVHPAVSPLGFWRNFLGLNRTGPEANHSPPLNVEVTN
jgi:hypothetical protein